MRNPTRGALAALVVLAAAAGGCGGAAAAAKSNDPRPEIRRVHKLWFDRLAAGDTRACKLLTQRARFAMVNPEDGACFHVVDRFSRAVTPEERPGFSRIEVRRIDVRGGRATIADHDLVLPPELATFDADNGRPMVLRRVEYRWRIDVTG
jgi:hypothetical protein